MKCTNCQFEDTRVLESRVVGDGEATRRRRECTKCKERFTTYERVETPQLIVIKQDGMRELFSQDKLLSGLLRACEKTTVTRSQLDSLLSDVQKTLLDSGESEISSRKIGELVIERLAEINEVAYVRFASVYRRFQTLAGFEAELTRIRNRTPDTTA